MALPVSSKTMELACGGHSARFPVAAIVPANLPVFVPTVRLMNHTRLGSNGCKVVRASEKPKFSCVCTHVHPEVVKVGGEVGESILEEVCVSRLTSTRLWGCMP